MADAIERVRATADQRGLEIVLHEPSPPVAVMGDRRQLVSAMHALLENAITYSYDNSKVVVTGTVQRFNPNLSHASLASLGSDRLGPRRRRPGAIRDEPGESPAVGAGATPTPAAGTRRGTPAPPGDPVEAAFTPEILDQDAPLGQTAPGARRPPAPRHRPCRCRRSSRPSVTPPEPVRRTQRGRPPELAHEERDNVRLSVQDHGVGIPARDLDRIFERFYRVDHGRSRDTGGTGLGLSIVRHVANNHQGWVDVESREGEGSTFTLVLPVQAERLS